MQYASSRFSAALWILTVGFGTATASAQTVDGSSPPAASAPIPVASVAPAVPGQPSDGGIAHTDAKGRHVAPHGTFYLLEYVSAETDKGVEGFEPGQEVHFVEAHRATHTLVVSDGRAQVEVSPSKLTNDMDIASMVRQKDQANQSKIAAYVQSEEAAYAKAEKEAAEASAKELDKHRQQEVAESAVSNQLQNAQPTQTVQQADASVSTNGYGYYNEGNYGYGSPYSYFGNGNNTVVVSAPAGTGSAPAAPATVPGASGGNKVGVGGHAGGGRGK